MSSSKNQSFRARLGFACAGILAGLRSEHSLRWQFLALAGILIVLLIFQPGALWYALVALSSAGVIAAELFNTALEVAEVTVEAFGWLIEDMVNGMGGISRYEIDARETADHSLPYCVAVSLVVHLLQRH